MATRPNVFVKQTVDELRKVTWPTRTEIIRLTLSVIVISIGVGIFLGLLDLALAKGLQIVLTK